MVYEKIPAKSRGGEGEKAELFSALQFLTSHFGKKMIRVLDSGYDWGDVHAYFAKNEENYIVRVAQFTRIIEHEGQKKSISDALKSLYITDSITFKRYNGEEVCCEIGSCSILLKKQPMRLVVCRGWGEKPLILLTNVAIEKDFSLIKAYLLRWRIEESFKFKKQAFSFEKFQVRSFKSIQNLNALLLMLIGFIAMLSEKRDESLLVAQLIQLSKRLRADAKFNFYAILTGLTQVFRKTKASLGNFLQIPKPSPQLAFAGWKNGGW